MSKLMPVVVMMSAVIAGTAPAFSEEKSEEKSPAKAEVKSVGEEAAQGAEEESAQIFEVGFDFDFYSAYVWRNAVSSDEMVMQPSVWADLTYFEPFWLGFSIWQNYDLTDRRCETFKYGLNETDYNIHLGATAWQSENEEQSVDFELGHEWFTYHGVRSDGPGCPNVCELYLKSQYDNPFVGVYGQTSWMYDNFEGLGPAMHYELGLNKEIEIVESLTLGADWNLNFGDSRYLSFLYGGVSNPRYVMGDDGEPEEYDAYDRGPAGGIAGTTVKLYLTWQITDWMSLGGVVAYTGLLNGELRDSIGEQGGDYEFCGNPGVGYPRDLCWGGLQLKISY